MLFHVFTAAPACVYVVFYQQRLASYSLNSALYGTFTYTTFCTRWRGLCCHDDVVMSTQMSHDGIDNCLLSRIVNIHVDTMSRDVFAVGDVVGISRSSMSSTLITLTLSMVIWSQTDFLTTIWTMNFHEHPSTIRHFGLLHQSSPAPTSSMRWISLKCIIWPFMCMAAC